MYDQPWNIPEKEVEEGNQSLKNPRNPRRENPMSLKAANQRNQKNVNVVDQKKVAPQVQNLQAQNLQNPPNLQNLTPQQLLRIRLRHRPQLLRVKIFLLKRTQDDKIFTQPWTHIACCIQNVSCSDLVKSNSHHCHSVSRLWKWTASTVSFCFIFSRNKVMTCNVSHIFF